MKKVLIIVAICLVVIAGAVLGGLYFIGDKIIDESIDQAIDQTVNVSEPAIETVAESSVSTGTAVQALQSSPASVSVTSGSTVTASSNNNNNNKAITVEKMKQIKEEVTAKDKVSAATLVMSRLSPSEINQLKSMAAGGLTSEEKQKAISIAYSHFSGEEIKQIKEMYKKYMNK